MLEFETVALSIEKEKFFSMMLSSIFEIIDCPKAFVILETSSESKPDF